jgi:shikimate kinase
MLFFLTGFMGSGKSYWGKIWAAANNFTFTDLDEVIETDEGKAIAEIFESKGETYFREVESIHLRTFNRAQNTIVACGGGTPCFNENMQWMNAHGTTIYLLTTVNEILNRVLAEQEKRPLIKKMNQGELVFFIEQKLKERAAYYNSAKIIIPSSELSLQTFSNLLSAQQSPV